MKDNLDIIIRINRKSGSLIPLLDQFQQVLNHVRISYTFILALERGVINNQRSLEKLSKDYPIKIIQTSRDGKTQSLLDGMSASQAEFIAYYDENTPFSRDVFTRMLDLLPENQVIIASRKNSRFSRIHNSLTRTLLGIQYDVNSGLKILPRVLVDYLPLGKLGKNDIDIWLLHTAIQLGYSVAEVFQDIPANREEISAWQHFTAVLKTKIHTPSLFAINGPYPENNIGSGIVHKKHRFVTHTRLPLSDSAVPTLYPWQKAGLLVCLLLVLLGFYFTPLNTAIFLTAILTSIYLLDTLFSLYIVLKSLHFPPELTFSDSDLASLDRVDLPVYSILCPLYREAGVLPAFVDSITGVDWPKNKLDVILLLEADDQATITAAQNYGLPSYIRTIIVPDSQPKTKPKACNYGLNFVRGEYVVVYDAEDQPDPLQLKKAYLGFLNSPQKVACLQGKLNFYNPGRNLLTRLFTAEYSLWFDVVLPGLQSINTTIPLGGTSNHFRTRVLKSLHGWDAFNVTEDCDLGARLFKNGFQTAMIDSTTLEEANGNLASWIRQRSRWIKGYIQTFLVHNRHPLAFLKKHGIHALIFQLVIGLRITFMVINPFLWLTTIAYFTLYRYVGPQIEAIYPPIIFYMAVFSAVIGNFMFFYNYMIGCAKRDRWDLVKYIYLVPFYWLMISFAAVKAVYQLVVKPHYWEKTHHGINLDPKTVPEHIVLTPELAFNFTSVKSLFSRQNLGAGALIASSVFSNFFNFLYNAFLSHSPGITLSDFGIISLMGSFYNLLEIPAGALARTVTYRSGFLFGRFNLIPKQFWAYIRENVFRLSLVITALWLILSPWLPAVFGSHSAFPFILFSPVWIIGTLSAVDGGFLAGNTRFTILAVATVSESVIKFLLTMLFIHLGWNNLVYAAIPLASSFPFLFTWLAARTLKTSAPLPDKAAVTHFPRKFFASSLLVRISALSFLSLDIVFAKMFLNPVQAGQYALISLVGKMVYFAGGTFSQFITPLVSRAEGAGKNSKQIFYRILLVTTLVSLAVSVVFGVFGKITAPLLFGSKILPLSGLLPWFTLAMVAFTIASNIVNYYQIRHQYIFSYLSVITSPVQVLFLYSAKNNLTAFVYAMFYYSIFYLFLVGLGHLYYDQIKNLIRNFADFTGLFRGLPDNQIYNSQKLRLLIFNWRDTGHVWAGGAEVYIQEMSKRWVSQGYQVTVFCGNDGKSRRNEIKNGVRIIRRGGFFTVYIWAVIYYFLKFRGQFDVIIDCENGIPFFTPIYSRLPVFLLIHHIHQNVFREHLAFPLSSLAVFLESKVMPLVYKHHQVLTVSESSKTDIVDLGLAPAQDISVVNPGIDPDMFHPCPKTPYPSFIYLGRLRPYKNIDVAIKAFAVVVKSYPAARFFISGWGENLDNLRALAAKLHLGKSVIFTQRVSEKQKSELLGRGWAMLQPSSFEGWGITVIEANACGTPVIASDVGGLRDSVASGRTGVLVPVKNIEFLTRVMLDLVKNTDNLTRFSRAALTWSRLFDWNSKADQFISVIESSLNSQTQLPQTQSWYAPAD